jgi:hypothetical protein
MTSNEAKMHSRCKRGKKGAWDGAVPRTKEEMWHWQGRCGWLDLEKKSDNGMEANGGCFFPWREKGGKNNVYRYEFLCWRRNEMGSGVCYCANTQMSN